MKTRWICLFAAVFAISVPAHAKHHRSSAAKSEFKRADPCPSTGKSRGACPGYVINHIRPLCAGGIDAPENLQWQSSDEAKRKDRIERRECGVRGWHRKRN